MADTRAGLDLSTSAKVATNPFLEPVHFTSFAGSASVDPWLQIKDPQSLVELRGNFTVDAYTQHYGTDTSGDAQLNASKQLSPYVGISGAAAYRTAITGIHTLLLTGNTSATTAQPVPTTPLPDVTLSGLRTRSKTFDGHLGFDLKPSSRDTLNFYFGASLARYNDINTSDYNYYSAGLTYAHALSAHTSLQAIVVVAKSDYLRTRAGDGTIVTPQVGIEHQFSPTLTFGFSGGASISQSHRADGSLENFTSFSGQAHLCNRGERTTLCLNAARMAQPTANNRVSAVTSVSGVYSNQFSLKDFVSLTMQYSKNDNPGIQFGASQFYGMTASETHNFTRRFAGFISPSFSKITGNFTSAQSNFQVDVGLRFRFGALS
jgi:hypothetical protein